MTANTLITTCYNIPTICDLCKKFRVVVARRTFSDAVKHLSVCNSEVIFRLCYLYSFPPTGALCVFYDRRTCLLLRYFPVSLSLLYSRNSGKVKAKKLFSYKSCLTNIFFFYLSFSQSYICQKVLNISYIIIEFSVKYAMINLSYDARVRGSITL